MAEPDPEVTTAAHEWVSFDDAHGHTYLLDLTFLLSNWSCIWDRGCPGILDHATPELVQGCCSFGAHFTDEEDRDRVQEAANRLTAVDWQFKGALEDPYETDDDGDVQTAIHEGACVFLNRPGFPGGPGCALHRGAAAAGEHYIDWKPDVCWQLPLRLDEHVDDNERVITTLRQWRRVDWGEGGADLHSFCTETDQAFVDHEPVYLTLAEEIEALVGEDIYARLKTHVEQRSTTHFLPHPVVRRREPPAQR